jgi:uncharacterized protein (DUF111 family)
VPTKTARAIRHHPLIAIAFALAIVIGVPTAVFVKGVERQQQALIDYQVKDKIETCISANNSREALQRVLDRAASPPPTGAATVDLTALPAYQQLDQATQLYVQQLNQALQEPTGSANLKAIADDFRATNPSDLDCREIGKDLREELE